MRARGPGSKTVGSFFGALTPELPLTPIQVLINGLVADGVWATLDRLWIFAQATELLALVDLVVHAAATAVLSPTFTANQGYASDGATSYIDTNFDPSGGGFLYTQNSAHVGLYSQVASGGAGTGIGSFAAGKGTYLLPNDITGSHVINDGGPNFNVNVAAGMAILTRPAVNSRVVYSNGSSVGSDATVSTGIATGDMYVFTLNFAGVPTNFLNAGVSIRAVSIGGALDATQVSNFSSRINTYMTTVGANLY